MMLTMVDSKQKEIRSKSIIDYITITRGTKEMLATIVDKEGQFRAKEKNETDHNTIITTVLVATNLPRHETVNQYGA